MKDSRLRDIIHILSEYEKGNFSVPLPFHEGNDEVSVVIQKMAALRDSIGNANGKLNFDEERLNQVLDAIVRITTFDFSEKIVLSKRHDALDAISLGLNMLSHELEKRINELAHKNRELLKMTAVIETTAEAVTTITPEGILTSWNNSAQRIYGYTAAEMIGKKPEEALMHPDERQNFRNMLARVMAGEQIYNLQTRRVRKDGALIDVAISLTPIIWKGKLVSVSIISRDITAELRAEKLVRESEERYRLLVQSIKDYAVFTMDPKGIIVSANTGAVDVTGYSENELIGSHVSLFYTPKAVAENQPQRHLQYALERGMFRFTGWKMKKGGIKMWSETVCAPFFDEHGNLRGFSKVMQDITERKIAEDTMKEHQEQIETIISNAPSAVIVIDDKSNIVNWNAKAEDIFGWKADEVLNRPMHSFIMPKRYVSKHYQGVTHFLKTGEGPVLNKVIEISAVRKNGEEFPIELGISAVKSKRKYLFIAFITDITERKKAEADIRNANEALDASNKELEAFTYSVSHDLRAPIRAIQGYTDILFAELKNKVEPEQEIMMKSVVKNTKKMAQLINDLLALSHLGQKELHREKISMNNVVNTVLDGIKASTDTSKTKFEISELPDAFADYNLMVQVFHNLISNAVKYSSRVRRPLVTIGSFTENSRTVYFVQDNGSGFDMKFYDKLFGVFQRLHSEQEYEGTGVGLSIVKRIIDKHHGKIWAQSEPGKGATFSFYLAPL